MIAGWIGIASGKHYATTNLYEPWNQVAQVVAGDARSGATIISENLPFFFYLDYELGVESETEAAYNPYLGEELYRTHGFKILGPFTAGSVAENARGKVVLVNGTSFPEAVQWTNDVSDRLRARCKPLETYQAIPDPAATLKAEYSTGAPILPYRVAVTWFECSN